MIENIPLNELNFSDLMIGLKKEFVIEITTEMIDTFAKLSGDQNPLHMDREYAIKLGFSDRVAHGCLVSSFLSQLVGMTLPGKHALFLSKNIEWKNPVFPKDQIHYQAEITNLIEALKCCEITVIGKNQLHKKVFKAQLIVKVMK